jgi:preprotein translocase subunit SecG
MQSVLIVIHLLVVIALVAVVLLQRSEGGALGAGGGGGFMTGRGQANALSRATAILGGLFFASALLMSILAGWNRAPRSILDTNAPSNKASTDSTKPAGSDNLLDQLKSMGEKPAESPAPAPAAPAPAAPAPAAPAPAPDAPK